MLQCKKLQPQEKGEKRYEPRVSQICFFGSTFLHHIWALSLQKSVMHSHMRITPNITQFPNSLKNSG
jgi:hypothetical protein